MNFFTPKKLYPLLLAVFTALSPLISQGYETVVLVQSSSFTETYNGFTPIFIKSPSNGTATSQSNNGVITLTYTSDSAYIGRDTVLMQYRTGPAPKGDIFYVGFDFDMRSSIVTAQVDYYAMVMNQSQDTLDVLLNDQSTAGGLKLSKIMVSSGGTSGLVGDSLMWFNPAPDYEGMAQVDYLVCDSVNTCVLGQAIIAITDTLNIAQRDTIIRSTKKNTSIELVLPLSDFVEDLVPSNGSLVQLEDHVFEYIPNSDFVGVDTFAFENPDLIVRDVFLYVLDAEPLNSFLIDDEVATAEDVLVSFNVQDNDLTGTRFKVKSYTTPDEGDLTYKGDGDFEYDPPSGFSGLKTFTYTVCPSNGNCETAEVRIFISNSKPENTFNYKFNTLKNVPLVINYQVPISYFEFDEHLAPVHGVLDIYDGVDTINVECDTITGNNLVVYYPDTDYSGKDEFQLEYSIPQTGYSAIIKVEVLVINENPDSTCACINGCVWPGDVDYDGRVTMKDLLPLGYFVGREGPERSAHNPNHWIGAYCDDWDYAINNWNINPKHADTDGNGEVNAADTSAILDYYYNEHNLVEKDISLPRKFPLTLEPLFSKLDSGDTAIILVGIGTDEFPVYDLSGFTYSYFYDPDIVDSASLKIDFHNDSWFADRSPILNLYKQPWDGRVDAGFTRTGGKVITGFGVVSTLSFGVEEDVEGFKIKGKERIITVKVDEGYAMDAKGDLFRIPGASIDLKLTGKSVEPDAPADPEKLAIFPNPTSGSVQLFLNGDNHIQSAELLNLTGQVIERFQIGRTKRAQLDLSVSHNGFYLLRVQTTRGPIVKKIQVYR